MIQSKAMLIELVISQWTATKLDKKVSTEVETSHGAKNAGRFNKQLIAKEKLQAIDKAVTAARDYHHKMTMPWSDSGPRLLPAREFLNYQGQITSLRSQFEDAVSNFIAEYPALVQDARLRLNTLFNPDEYPNVNQVEKKFSFATRIMPVPEADDFRVSLNKDEVERVRRQIDADLRERQAGTVRDCYARIRNVVERISTNCRKEKPRFHDSMMESTGELVQILASLNITEDPEIERLRQSIQDQLLVSSDALRNSPTLRVDIADRADELLASMKW